jgi:hypothetical protein
VNQPPDYADQDDDLILEAYCVRCKQTVEVEHPQAVWTRRGMPAARGECPDCSGTVFRMGWTPLHDQSKRPDAVQVGGSARAKLARDTAYIAFADQDEASARAIAADLEKSGVAIWLHTDSEDTVQWAGGVHPALAECGSLVVLLSPAALTAAAVTTAWQFFKDKRKPILIAQVAAADPPDSLRRSPRFDFSADYKSALRQLVQAL